MEMGKYSWCMWYLFNVEQFLVSLEKYFRIFLFKILEGLCALHVRTHKDTIRVQGPLGKVLSDKQHSNLQDLEKLLLLGGGPF